MKTYELVVPYTKMEKSLITQTMHTFNKIATISVSKEWNALTHQLDLLFSPIYTVEDLFCTGVFPVQVPEQNTIDIYKIKDDKAPHPEFGYYLLVCST